MIAFRRFAISIWRERLITRRGQMGSDKWTFAAEYSVCAFRFGWETAELLEATGAHLLVHLHVEAVGHLVILQWVHT